MDITLKIKKEKKKGKQICVHVIALAGIIKFFTKIKLKQSA